MANRRRQLSSRISRLARKSPKSIGFILVQMPPGDRKSGMPHSVEMPAPVNGTTASDRSNNSRNCSCALSSSFAIIVRSVTDQESTLMRYLHTMLRVRNLDDALDFYVNKLGMKESRRRVDEKNRYTLVFLIGPDDEKLVEESKKEGRPGLEVEL